MFLVGITFFMVESDTVLEDRLKLTYVDLRLVLRA